METNEKAMTPEESLQIIQKSISTSRKNMKSGSFYYLLWGWVLLFSSLLCYFVLRYLIRNEIYEYMYLKSLLCWLIPIVIGYVIQFIQKGRQRNKQLVRTYIDRYLTILWASAGVTFVLMVVICYLLDVYPTPFILSGVGLVTFVSGNMIRYTPLMIGGLISAAAAVVAVITPGLGQLLVFAVVILLGYLLPGYLLRFSNGERHV
jgi:hypothetical protein